MRWREYIRPVTALVAYTLRWLMVFGRDHDHCLHAELEYWLVDEGYLEEGDRAWMD